MATLTREQSIDIFQLEAFSLREEEVDYWHPSRVEYSENDVRAPTNVVDCGRRNLDDQVVADPISRCRYRGATLT